MRDLITVLTLAISVSCTPAVAAVGNDVRDCNRDYLIHDSKAYRYSLVYGECLLSNKWSPVVGSGYTEEYKTTNEYQVVKHANQYIRNNRRDKE